MNCYVYFLMCSLHSLGNSVSYTRIKCCRKNVLVAQFAVINRSSNCVGSSQFHFFGDSGCASFRRPRKMPGKMRTLLTWFGKSERPVPTTLAPAAFARSGMILRNRVAIAKRMESLFMEATISWERCPEQTRLRRCQRLLMHRQVFRLVL